MKESRQRHIIIGDVHGMAIELERLLCKLKLRKDDHIIFVGDLLDKGPLSAEVVRIALELSTLYSVTLVEGNHEEKHKRFRNHLINNRATAFKMKNATEMQQITKHLSVQDVAFLEQAVLFHRIPEHNILIVHGGIPGSLHHFPTSEEIANLTKKEHKKFKLIQRTRFVDSQTGKFLSLGHNTSSDPFWADVYDGRFGHVIFGHEPFLDGIREFKHATGIDTGAVFGASLSALILNQDGSRQYLSVNSTQSYATPL